MTDSSIDTRAQTVGEFRTNSNPNPTSEQLELAARIRRQAADLIDLISTIHDGVDPENGRPEHVANERRRLKALAQTHIEDAAMWGVKAATKA